MATRRPRIIEPAPLREPSTPFQAAGLNSAVRATPYSSQSRAFQPEPTLQCLDSTELLFVFLTVESQALSWPPAGEPLVQSIALTRRRSKGLRVGPTLGRYRQCLACGRPLDPLALEEVSARSRLPPQRRKAS